MKATVDRIEGGKAILLVSGGQGDASWEQPSDEVRIELPLALLPADACEGDLLELTLQKDEEATREARIDASALLDRLKRRDLNSGMVQDPP